jgi:hypothetical protein
MALLTIFASLALLLAAAGVYGVSVVSSGPAHPGGRAKVATGSRRCHSVVALEQISIGRRLEAQALDHCEVFRFLLTRMQFSSIAVAAIRESNVRRPPDFA